VASRNARPNPSAPLAPMIVTDVSLAGTAAEYRCSARSAQ
jgi:hypothetical protein